MGRRPFVAGTLGGVLCAAIVCAVNPPEANASGYLPRTGPVPLRFGEVRPVAQLVLPPLMPAPVTPEPATPAPTPQPATITKDALAPAAETAAKPAAEPPPATAATPVPPVSPDAAAASLERLYGDAPPPPDPSIPGPMESTSASQPPAWSGTASDMLVVTPQMLVNYFKPARGNTNAVGVAVLVPVGFTPPSATGSGSQATYRVQ